MTKRPLEMSLEILKIIPLVMRTVAAELRAAGELPAPAHFGLLTMLSVQPRTLSELANLQGVSLPTMSNSITSMVQRGWVRRTAPAERSSGGHHRSHLQREGCARACRTRGGGASGRDPGTARRRVAASAPGRTRRVTQCFQRRPRTGPEPAPACGKAANFDLIPSVYYCGRLREDSRV